MFHHRVRSRDLLASGRFDVALPRTWLMFAGMKEIQATPDVQSEVLTFLPSWQMKSLNCLNVFAIPIELRITNKSMKFHAKVLMMLKNFPITTVGWLYGSTTKRCDKWPLRNSSYETVSHMFNKADTIDSRCSAESENVFTEWISNNSGPVVTYSNNQTL